MPITKYIKGNLLDHEGPIAHGVNCQGKMASGVAKAIREKYPEHYEDYLHVFSHNEMFELDKYFLLGKTVITNPEGRRPIFGIFSQFNYGYDGKRYVNYVALANAFSGLNFRFHLSKNTILGIPKIGAGLGGGDWVIIEQIINDATQHLPVWVYEI